MYGLKTMAIKNVSTEQYTNLRHLVSLNENSNLAAAETQKSSFQRFIFCFTGKMSPYGKCICNITLKILFDLIYTIFKNTLTPPPPPKKKRGKKKNKIKKITHRGI